MGTIVCDIAPGGERYPLDALRDALDECEIEYVEKTNSVSVSVSPRELGLVMDVIARDHDEANLEGCFGLLEATDADLAQLSETDKMVFYAIQEDFNG